MSIFTLARSMPMARTNSAIRDLCTAKTRSTAEPRVPVRMGYHPFADEPEGRVDPSVVLVTEHRHYDLRQHRHARPAGAAKPLCTKRWSKNGVNQEVDERASPPKRSVPLPIQATKYQAFAITNKSGLLTVLP